MHATIELHSLILSVPSYSKHYKPLSRVIYIELFMCCTLDTWVLPHISYSRSLLSSCNLSARARLWDWIGRASMMPEGKRFLGHARKEDARQQKS